MKRSSFIALSGLLVIASWLLPAIADAAQFRRVPSTTVTEVAANTMKGIRNVSRGVSISGTLVTPLPGYGIYTDSKGSVLILQSGEQKPTVTINPAETWQKFDGRIVVFISCACEGKADDNCEFETWSGGKPVFSSCGGEECCAVFQLIIDMETGNHQVL